MLRASKTIVPPLPEALLELILSVVMEVPAARVMSPPPRGPELLRLPVASDPAEVREMLPPVLVVD